VLHNVAKPLQDDGFMGMRKERKASTSKMHPLMKENYINVVAKNRVLLQELYTTKSKSRAE
jgi:hypothetical protein